MGLPLPSPSAPLSMGPVIPPPEVYRGPPGAARSGGVSGGGEVYVNTTTTTLLEPPRSPRLKLWPCFGCISLRTACVVIGVFGCVADFIYFVMGLVVVTQNQHPGRHRDDSSTVGAAMIVGAILAAILDVILIIGARTRSRCLCLTWFLAQLIGLIVVIFLIISGRRGSVEDVVGSLFTIYFMVVVACYIKELERTDLEEQGPRRRTVMMMTDLPPIITTQRYDPFPNLEATAGTATQSGVGYYGENFGSSYGPPPRSYQAWKLENPVVANLNAERPQPQVHYPALAGSLA